MRNDNNLSMDKITDKKYVDLIKSVELLREDNANLSQDFPYDLLLDTQTMDMNAEVFNVIKHYHTKEGRINGKE
jgi:hypothetical protein